MQFMTTFMDHQPGRAIPEFELRLRKSRRTVHRMAASGALPVVQKLPTERGAYLFDRDAVEQLAQEAAK